MKKIMALVLAMVLVFAMIPMTVSARTLTDDEKALFELLRTPIELTDGEFILPEDVVAQGENYVAALSTALTPAQISKIEAEVRKAIAAVKAEDTGDVSEWSQKTRNEILSNIDTAAQEIGCTAVADTNGGIEIKDAAGATVVANDTLVKVTGFNAQSMIVVGLCALTVLCACVFVSKKVELF